MFLEFHTLSWDILVEFFCCFFSFFWADHCDLYTHSKFTFSPLFHLIKRNNNSIFVLIYVSLSANTFRSKVYVALYWKPPQEATVSDVRGWMLYFTTQPCQVIKPARVADLFSCFLSAVSCTPILISSDSVNVEKDRLQTDPLSQRLVLVFRHLTSVCWSVLPWLTHTGHCKICYTDE